MRALMVGLLVLSSCNGSLYRPTPAVITPYQPLGPHGGYVDHRIDAMSWVVEVRANGNTPRSVAISHLHRRAAELCRSIGYPGYDLDDVIHDADVVQVRRHRAVAVRSGTVASASGRSTSTSVTKPRIIATVTCD